MNDTVRRWHEVLDAIDAQIEHAARAVTAGHVAAMPSFAVPSGLPTLPGACAARAREVAERQRALELLAKERLAMLPQPSTRQRRTQRPPSRVARFETRA